MRDILWGSLAWIFFGLCTDLLICAYAKLDKYEKGQRIGIFVCCLLLWPTYWFLFFAEIIKKIRGK